MKSVLVVVDNHLGMTPDGKVWSKGIYNYSFFARYLSAFSHVYITVRIEKIDETHKGYTNLCSGENVFFLPLPEFRGVSGYLKNYFKVNKLIKEYVQQCDCSIIRIPSAIGYQFARMVDGIKPYALEVVIDPWDFAAPGMLKSKFRPLIRLNWTILLKKYCMRANGVSYVTKAALQERYPSAYRKKKGKKYFESYYSSVNIPKEYYGEAKKYSKEQNKYKLLHVANAINSYVKGHKEAIDVVANLNRKGIDVSISFVGDGPYIEEFERYANKLSISNKVKFIGRISEKEKMREIMRNADLFILPTYGEGLPRVLIESMAVGTPCISTRVNGIPELLNEDQMAEVGDVDSLVEIIEMYLNNSEKLTQASKEAIEKAKGYAEEVLQIRRSKFYHKLADLVE